MSQASYPFDLLEVEGAKNVRDIGGYTGTGGRAVNKRRFIRAGGMHGLTAAGVQAVRDLGVGCVVDLRSRMEVERMPDTLREDSRIAYRHIPMLDYIQSNISSADNVADFISSFPDSMADMYVGLLENAKGSFLEVFRVFADPAFETVVFHCTAGKDRTGLTAMLLLGLAGVSHEKIVEDYSYSDTFFRARPEEAHLPRYLFESAPATMETAIGHLVGNYGGIVPYLEHIGVEGELKAAVLAKLL